MLLAILATCEHMNWPEAIVIVAKGVGLLFFMVMICVLCWLGA